MTILINLRNQPSQIEQLFNEIDTLVNNNNFHHSEERLDEAANELLENNELGFKNHTNIQVASLIEATNRPITINEGIIVDSNPSHIYHLEEFTVEAIVDHVQDYKTKKILYYVKWRGFSSDDNTWEEEKIIKVNCLKLLNKYKKKYNKENCCKFFKF
jgi:hypothetical protein